MPQEQGAGGGALSGATQGASAGAAFGPAGAAVGLIAGGILGGIGGYLGSRNASRKRRRLRRQLAFAQKRADETVSRLTAEGSTFARAKSFLDNTFSEGGNGAFASSVAQGVRAAQAGRGLFSGNIGALQEGQARGLAATKLQASLAPLAQTFEFAPEQLRGQLTQQFFSPGAGIESGELTSQFQGIAAGVLQGGAGGLQIGQSLGQTFNTGGFESQGQQLAGPQSAQNTRGAEFQQSPTAGGDPLQRFNNPSLLA